MKDKVKSLILIPLSFVAVTGSYFLYCRAETLRYQKEAELDEQLSFRVYDTFRYENWFIEDYLARCFFFLAILFLIVGVCLRKRTSQETSNKNELDVVKF